MRLEIQKKVLELVSYARFPIVQYDPDTQIPSLTGEIEQPRVWVNEIQGNITDKAENSSRERKFCLRNWVFEAHLSFFSEVVVEEFLEECISEFKLCLEDGRKVEVNAGAYNVTHPVQQGNQSGTILKITLTANTRR